MLFPLLCNTHASARRRLHESPSMAAASVSHVTREGPRAGCARLHQAATTPSQGRYINHQDDNTPHLYDTLVLVLSQHAKWVDQRHLKTLAWMMVGLIQSGWISLTLGRLMW